ncbi:MAG TPA: SDR family oxidoreductase [Pelovirga sp.]|nr:SDR family oxidoreductase [Pelovirga sp.]
MSDTLQPVALVTGGAQGIGKGIALRLEQNGFRVVIADINEEAGRQVVAESAGEITAITTDVSDEAAVKALFARVSADFGRLDALINNAGIADAHGAPLEQLELVDWNRMLATNLTGVFLCSKYAIPWLRIQRGSIVNLASTRALQSEPDTEAYSASKGGVVALTHAMAVSLGPQIRVNSISPGWIHVTDDALQVQDHTQHPVGRVGAPEDIAALVGYLVSDQAGFITGQDFVVDGGMTHKMIYVD